MLNKSHKTVWNKTTRTYAATSEVTKSRGAKGTSVCGSLVAASAGLLSALAFSQPAAAGECASSEQDCVSVAQALTAGLAVPAGGETGQPADLATAINNASVFTGNPAVVAAARPATVSSSQMGLLGASTPPSVTDYIAVIQMSFEGLPPVRQPI